jgi:hypothetical protein
LLRDSHRGAGFYRVRKTFETSTKIVRNWRQSDASVAQPNGLKTVFVATHQSLAR